MATLFFCTDSGLLWLLQHSSKVVPTRKAGNEKEVGNKVFMEAERQRQHKNLQGEGGTGWHQSKTSGDLSSEALHRLI